MYKQILTGAHYYEADDSGSKFTSTTGVGLWFKEDNSLTLFVKTHDTTKRAGIGNIYAVLPCTYDSTKWNNIKIVDDNKGKIEYYVNNEKIAIVEYSDLTEYEVFKGEKFFNNVTIKDKDGNVLQSTDIAFVYEYSEIAFGLRATHLNLDNILLKNND